MGGKNSLNLETLQHKRGKPSTEQHRHHDDTERGGKDKLPSLVLSVPDRQGEGYGPPQARKHQHVLETEADLLGAAQVEQEGEHIDVYQSAGENSNLVRESRKWSISKLQIFKHSTIKVEIFKGSIYISRILINS